MMKEIISDPQNSGTVKPFLSVVIPLLNEEKNLPELYKRMNKAISSYSKEVIFVDDGSTDNTFNILKQFHEKDPDVKIIRFRRNFGQTAALSAGFDHARGDIVITMDGDLQNDPEDIPRLLEKINAGYDVVSGWRANRSDPSISKKIPSRISNWLAGRLTGIKLHDSGCTLKAYRSDVIKNIRLYGEMHRYIPAVANWIGASFTEEVVEHHPRRFGKSKYGISRTIRVILDLITVKFLQSFSTRPIHAFGSPGLV